MGTRTRAAATAAAVAITVLVCVGLSRAAQQSGKTIRDGVFNAAQVERGTRVFDSVCGECHPKEDFGPLFMGGWTGATVEELFVQVQGTMPYESPGALKDAEYLDVLTYIFSLNGAKPGDQELVAGSDALKEIRIDGPYEWKGEGESRLRSAR
jgi:mono/diheme cytochrome c family protein